MNNVKYIGKIVWFVRGMGFIEYHLNGEQQKDMFLHYSDIACEGYKTVKKGDKVEFEIGVNKRDQPKAINVKVIT